MSERVREFAQFSGDSATRISKCRCTIAKPWSIPSKTSEDDEVDISGAPGTSVARLSRVTKFLVPPPPLLLSFAHRERDPTADLRGALAPVVVRNHSAISEPIKIGELLRP